MSSFPVDLDFRRLDAMPRPEDFVFGADEVEESPSPDFSFEVGEGVLAALEGSWRFMVRWAEVDVGSIRMV